MSEPRRLGRPSRIRETLPEARCAECGDWIAAALLRIHFEAEHPLAARPIAAEFRRIPIADRICEHVAGGVTLESAAAVCGIGRRTILTWRRIGEEWLDAEPEEIPEHLRPFAAFTAAYELARDAADARHHRAIERAAERDWKAHAWILERVRSARYARVDRLRVGGDPDAGPVRVIHEERDPDFIADVMAIYRRAGVIPDDGSEPVSDSSE